MKADKSKMFSVSTRLFKPNTPAPFPLYVFLRLNNRMVPVRLEGDSIGEQTYQELLSKHHDELWVPKSHEKEFQAYLEYLEKTRQPESTDPSEIIKEEEANKLQAAAAQASAETKEKTKKLLEALNAQASPEAIEALKGLSFELLKELRAVTESGKTARLIAAEKCRAFSNSFLEISATKDSLHEGILFLRSITDPNEHSIFVGSLSATLAAGAGHIEAKWISNLITAATFHDIGLTQLEHSIITKPTSKRTPQEQSIYQNHVRKGLMLLEQSNDTLPSNVHQAIQQHHERADGSGYPHGIQEKEIIEEASFLITANCLDNLCVGEETGMKLAPNAAFNQLQSQSPAGKKIAELLKKISAN